MRTRGTRPQLHTRTYRRKSKKKTAQPVALWMEHLMIRVSLCIFIVSYLNTFSNYCKTVLRIIKKTCVFLHWCRLRFAWCWLQTALRCWLLGFIFFRSIVSWLSYVTDHKPYFAMHKSKKSFRLMHYYVQEITSISKMSTSRAYLSCCWWIILNKIIAPAHFCNVLNHKFQFQEIK